MRQWFDSHSLALGAANRIRIQHDQFGFSLRMLPPARLTEAEECFDLLDKATTLSGPAPNGSLRKIVLAAIKAQKERTKSITLDELWQIYLERLNSHARVRITMETSTRRFAKSSPRLASSNAEPFSPVAPLATSANW